MSGIVEKCGAQATRFKIGDEGIGHGRHWGHFAIQFAKAKSAQVFTTVSTNNVDFARSLGADVETPGAKNIQTRGGRYSTL
jgi:NADPH:quinone reductase-like Zn-dependent oxidoreductase